MARGVLIALMAGVAVVLANNAGTLWIALLQGLGLTVYGSSHAQRRQFDRIGASADLCGALPGICEELMFRGVMLSAFERRGRMYGVVVSAALFALMHGSVSGLPVHFGLGVLMGLMAVRLDSLYAPMVFHIGYNSLAVMLDYALGGSDGSGAAMVNVVGALGARGHGGAGAANRHVRGADVCALADDGRPLPARIPQAPGARPHQDGAGRRFWCSW